MRRQRLWECLSVADQLDAERIYGVAVCKRLRLQQPVISSLYSGGSDLPYDRTAIFARSTSAPTRADDFARQSGIHRTILRSAGDLALQPLPFGGNRRFRGPRLQFEQGLKAMEQLAKQNMIQGMSYSWTGSPSKRSNRAARPFLSSAWEFSSSTLRSQHNTRASRCPSSFSSRCRWLSWALWAPCPAWHGERRLLPDRPCHAHRPLCQKLDSDRRVCRTDSREEASPSLTPRLKPQNCASAPF